MENSRINDDGKTEGNVRSVTLAARIAQAPLEVREVVELLRSACAVLQNIHQEGLAHADLTPGNLTLNGEGQIVIDSFTPPPSDATFIMSEAKYASPELLLAQAAMDGAAHVLSDIYILGFIAYEALVDQETFLRHSLGERYDSENELSWMKWHVDIELRLPPLLELNTAVPEELSLIIQKMIEKDPGKRFSNFDEVQKAVEQLRPRLMKTESIEISSLLEGVPKGTASNTTSQRKALRFAYVVAAGCLVFAVGWWLFGSGKPGTNLAASIRWIERSVSWVRTRFGDLASAQAPKASPNLPAQIETATGPMVLVKAGSFVMGSSVVPNEGPARTVYLSAFYIDKYEVSNARYRAFTDATGYVQPPAPSWDPDYFARGSLPVLNVSWRDAQAFCVAARKRLPLESEWEKAARGASPGSRYWANWTVNGLANLKRAGFTAPSPVGSFVADVSPFGVFDMAGNVHEWVNDQYGLYSGNRVSIEEAGTAKVVRGGSFALSPEELSPSWRASHEATIDAGEDLPVGFRCAADVRLGFEAQRQPISH